MEEGEGEGGGERGSEGEGERRCEIGMKCVPDMYICMYTCTCTCTCTRKCGTNEECEKSPGQTVGGREVSETVRTQLLQQQLHMKTVPHRGDDL